jgi:PAP2 superfamily protein
LSTPALEEHRSTPAPPDARHALAVVPASSATPWRSALAGPVVALAALAAAAAATGSAGVPLRDPGGVTVRRLATAVGVLLAFVAADAVARAARRTGMRGLSARAVLGALRARWTRERIALVAVAVLCFHLTYLAYRNVKSVAPLLRPGDLFDAQLLDVDRWLFGGRDPGPLLHSLLGTGAAAQVLADVYMLFFLLIPVVLAAGLVLLHDVRAGLHLATALSLTWLLGAGSYLLLPSIGPFHMDVATYADLPVTSVRELQDSLIAQRGMFLADPSAPGAAQGIGAFASLHTAICCTALIGAHLVRAPRGVKALLWVMTSGTVLATVYFGWHYLLDDVAGVGIALLALCLARLLDGYDPRGATA